MASRTARIFRAPLAPNGRRSASAVEHAIAAVATNARAGDLVTVDDEWFYRTADEQWETLYHYKPPNGTEPSPPTTWFLITRVATDHWQNALEHYADALDEQNAIATPVDRALHRLLIRVHVADTGLCSAFNLTEGDWAVVKRWEAITLARHAGRWWFTTVDFGNGLVLLSEPETCKLALEPPGVVAPLPPATAVTRDAPAIVKWYRASLKDCVEICIDIALVSSTVWRIVRDLVTDVVGPRHWRVYECESRSTSAYSHILAVRVVGPPPALDLEHLYAAVTDHESFDPDNVVLGVTSARGRLLADLAYNPTPLTRDSTLWDYKSVWAVPKHRWRAVHRVVFGAALALASRDLPHYVVLWILEWLPALRHHEPLRVLRLIESVGTSVRRVRDARPSVRGAE